MKNFSGSSFNLIYLRVLRHLYSRRGCLEESRAGRVVNMGQAYFEVAPDDVRLLFLNERAFNPVFAIVEGAWVLAGSDLLMPLEAEIQDFAKYSDDGVRLNGAYGKRLTSSFGYSQIDKAVDLLRNDPSSRQVVLTLYSPDDLGKVSKDIPCNTSIFVKVRSGRLDFTVLNRSNDAFKGVPYNVFVFGLVQRQVADRLGLQVGVQRHFTDSLHLYEADFSRVARIIKANRVSAVDEVSGRFDWDYSIDIVRNRVAILKGNFDEVGDPRLASFLRNFNRKARNASSVEFNFREENDLYSFLGYQFSSEFRALERDFSSLDEMRALLLGSGFNPL